VGGRSYVDFDAVRSEIDAWTEKGEKRSPPYEKLIRKLLDDGGAEGLELVLALMEDESLDVYNKPSLFADLLEGVEDPRIVEAAERLLKANLSYDLTGASSTKGYIRMIVERDPEGSAGLLLSLIGEESGPVAAVASGFVGATPAPSLEGEFIALAMEGPHTEAIVRSLLNWDLPETTQKLV